MVNWRIYYGDGTTFSDADGPAEKAPSVNVQAIAQVDAEIGRRLVSRYDFYWFDDGSWYGGDFYGLFDYLQRYQPSIVKFGRALSRAKFEEVLRVAYTDPDLAPKMGTDPSEHLS